MDMSKVIVMNAKEGFVFINQKNLEMLAVKKEHVDELVDVLTEDKENDSCIEFRKPLEEENFVKETIASEGEIAIFPTLKCNFSCTYCFEKGFDKKEMTQEMIPYIKKYVEYWNQEMGVNIKTDSINLMGGEVFRKDSKDLMEVIFNEFPDSAYHVTTNGVEVMHFKDWIEKTNPHIIFSIDGPEEIHLKKRRTKIQGAYKKIIESIRYAVDKGLKVSITSVLNPEYKAEDYIEFLDLLEDLGWPENEKIDVTFNTEMLPGGMECDKEITLKTIALYHEMLEKDERAFYVGRNLIPTAMRLEDALMSKREHNAVYRAYCNASRMSSLFFFPDGKVYNCNLVQNEQNCIGTFYPTFSINKDRIHCFLNRKIEESEKCSNCDRVHFCQGGCPSSAIGRMGDIKEGFCGVWKDPELYKHVDLVIDVEKLYEVARRFEVE